jgi:phosphate transport system substrate-binding protein
METHFINKGRIKFLFSLVVIALISSLFAPGCQVFSGDSAKKSKTVKRIRISGSNTSLPLLRIMARAYENEHPDVEIAFLPGAHSKAGIQGVMSGNLDIGGVSRPLKPEESTPTIRYKAISNDGLVIAANKSTTVSDLTTDQIKNIYNGTIQNWKEVGGRDASIVILDRAEDESAKIILRQYVLGDLVVTGQATVLFLETDMIKAIQNTPNSIGYLSLGYALSEKPTIKVLKLDGVEPSVTNIYNDTYKMVRPLAVVYKSDASAQAKEFVSFMLSKDGQGVMEKNGYAVYK